MRSWFARLVCCGALLVAAASALGNENRDLLDQINPSVRDVSASFPPGPFTTIAVDPANADRVAVGTSDGLVSWSWNGGLDTSESQVFSPRIYSINILRSAGANGRKLDYSGANGPPAPATRLFMYLLNNGLPTTRWNYWMASSDLAGDIKDIALPSTNQGRMAVAAALGIYVADSVRGSWSLKLGESRPLVKNPLGLSVAIDPGDPRHLLAGTAQGVLVSDDGGQSFKTHPDSTIASEEVTRFVWSGEDPSRVLAIAGSSVLLSTDRGKKFTVALSVTGSINGVALDASTVFVATSDGLMVAENGPFTPRLKGETIVGVVSLGQKQMALAATEHELILSAPDASRVLTRAANAEAFQALAGTPATAWLLTKHNLFRISAREERKARRTAHPPKMLRDLITVEQEMVHHLGLGRPEHTRLNDRWFSEFLPDLTVHLAGMLSHAGNPKATALTTVNYGSTTLESSSSCCGGIPMGGGVAFVVMANWDLAKMIGNLNISNPNGMIEANLRTARDHVLEELRWRYREAANLVRLLERPPEDQTQALLWRFRLEEYATYLHTQCGCAVVEMGDEQSEEN